MRLFLSSYRAGRHDKQLLRLLGGIKKVAYISNAKDYKTPKDRREKIKENFDYWRSINLRPAEIDLRPYFHRSGAKKQLAEFEFIWLAGGNVFLLRRALKYTGLDKYLTSQVNSNSIILGGESAGAIITGPTLKFSEEDYDEDSPNFIPGGYKPDVLWDGLGLINFIPVPHYKTPGYGAIIDKWIKRLDKAGLAHKQMTDDQAIMINGGKEELLK